MSPSEIKKWTKSRATSIKVATKGVVLDVDLGEGTSTNPRVGLGPDATVLGTPGMAEKLLQRLVLPANQVDLDKLDLGGAITRFFHYVGQVSKSFTSVSYFYIFIVLTSFVFCRR